MRPKKNSDEIILGGNQLSVLQAVFRLNSDAYGGEIYVHLNEAGDRLHLPRIYTILNQLEQKGLVTHELVKPADYTTGRTRKVYTLTMNGHRVLQLSLKAKPRLGRGEGWTIPGLPQRS